MRARDAKIEKLMARLTRQETRYRSSVNALRWAQGWVWWGRGEGRARGRWWAAHRPKMGCLVWLANRVTTLVQPDTGPLATSSQASPLSPSPFDMKTNLAAFQGEDFAALDVCTPNAVTLRFHDNPLATVAVD